MDNPHKSVSQELSCADSRMSYWVISFGSSFFTENSDDSTSAHDPGTESVELSTDSANKSIASCRADIQEGDCQTLVVIFNSAQHHGAWSSVGTTWFQFSCCALLQVFYESFDKSWKGRWIVSHKGEFTGTRWQATDDEYSVQGGGKREREHKLKQRDQQKLKPKSIIHYLFWFRSAHLKTNRNLFAAQSVAIDIIYSSQQIWQKKIFLLCHQYRGPEPPPLSPSTSHLDIVTGEYMSAANISAWRNTWMLMCVKLFLQVSGSMTKAWDMETMGCWWVRRQRSME